MTQTNARPAAKRRGLPGLIDNVRQHPVLYIMALPVILYFIVFHYAPMYGLVIAFKNYVPARGIMGSKWVGLSQFSKFFNDMYFFRLIRNTLVINLKLLLFGFPVPIVFAILLSEMRRQAFKRTVQTITYMPHFISAVVVCGIFLDFTKSNGIITWVVSLFGGEKIDLMTRAENFQTIFVGMNVWQEFGWDSIIYFAALSAIDPTMYEAAMIDGASRFKRILHITLPSLLPTITILLVLRIGNMMSLGWERIVLMYNPLIYETSDVISSYVYRRGLVEFNYSYSAAVGMFNSVCNVALLTIANFASRKLTSSSLW